MIALNLVDELKVRVAERGNRKSCTKFNLRRSGEAEKENSNRNYTHTHTYRYTMLKLTRKLKVREL